MAGYHTPPGDGLEPFIRELKDIRTQLRDLQRPSGTNIGNTAAQVQLLVAKVEATLVNIDSSVQTSISANSYTKSVIDGKIATPPSVAATGAVSGTTGTFNTGLYSTDAYSFNITGTRVSGWHQSDGHIGTASSSERYKTNIAPANIDPLAVLSIGVKHYNYIAEVAKRDDSLSPDYVGPDYKVHVEVGAIAEELHAAGLWEFVVYERTPDGNLLRDSSGGPIPEGIHYQMFSVAVLSAAQYLNKLVAQQGNELADIQVRLTAAGI
ncbi:tail fiber domain-containing protein [Cryobacterium sp. Hh11]|uniref:tail fiber domain-containing protein n=1 Tax=Cryobacterium sp. Hh11 TaxID=2555868 RepID=UPI0011051B7C|nr:tail fiber domain-containing protein [Cryobacterium sp. Hh11]TFD51949.1 tail fiber domain-containing protein [Cryobacterium sp. Hh11]